MCCDKTAPFSGVHCHLTEDGQDIESSAKFYHNFSRNWQSLDDGRKLLPVQNKHNFVILDLKKNAIFKIDRTFLPPDHKAVGYFFSMDTYAELAELVKTKNDQFKICDYVPDNQHNYLLKEEVCRETNMTVTHEFPRIKFCDNPYYSAVLQYGNHEYEPEMEWMLQVKIERSPDPYYVLGQDVAPLHQVAINCREDSIDMYIPGRHELYQYSIFLPNELTYD
uniref:Carb-bd_dom_fam9 domain-containing protein n=1 Tax=Steinernema glaseri TaxID=37863 RepID=A0A1I7Y8M8_9BILA